MNVYYENKRVEKVLEDFATLQKKCGKHSLQLKRRMQQLKSFVNLKEFMNSGFDNPHIEQGDMDGLIGWDVNQNVRLLLKIDEKLDETFMQRMEMIRDIKIIGVLDYHGGKKNWIIS